MVISHVSKSGDDSLSRESLVLLNASILEVFLPSLVMLQICFAFLRWEIFTDIEHHHGETAI